MKNVLLFAIAFLFAAPVFARIEQPPKKGQKPTVVVMYTEEGDKAEDLENLLKIAQFAFDEYDKEHDLKTDIRLVAIDDKDDPQAAVKALKRQVAQSAPLAIVGPIYSNVALGLKDYINKTQIPMVSIFATHNDLTKNTRYVFRICASNRRLVNGMADFLVPEVQKHHLNVIVFKDLSDDYSMDLADTFRLNVNGINMGYDEVLFKGVDGIERLRDLNSQIWRPSKKDVLFLPVRDIVASHIIRALETEPYMIAAIDPVDFLHLVSRIKKERTHIRLVTTSQWLPQKSAYSKKIEADFKTHFHYDMTITSALTYDAAYTVAAAYQRALEKGITLTEALRDGTKLTGVTGLIFIGRDGERVFSDQFLKEDVIE